VFHEEAVRYTFSELIYKRKLETTCKHSIPKVVLTYQPKEKVGKTFEIMKV
jgi:hypothetical protein